MSISGVELGNRDMTGSVVFPYSGTLWHAFEQEGGVARRGRVDRE